MEKIEKMLQKSKNILINSGISFIPDECIQEFLFHYWQGLFIKRRKIESKLLKFIENSRNGLIFISGDAGFGKTTFLVNFIKILNIFGYNTVFHFFSNNPVMEGLGTSTKIAISNLLGQIAYYIGKNKIDTNNYFMFDGDRFCLRKMINEISLEKKEKMVIIIDGLDNSKPLLEYPPFPEKLPEGVFVITSADFKEVQEENVFKEWENMADLDLKFAGMGNDEIISWFLKSENEKLKEFTKNNLLIEEIAKKTGGLPLYLSYLIKDIEEALKNGKDVGELLENTPDDFEKYIQNHYEKLCQLGITKKCQKILATLTIAKDYLSLKDIKELVDLDDNDINHMKYDKELTRWFSIIYKENEVYFAFRHQLIGKVFSKIMPDDVKKAEENIIKYCSKWERNKSKYAICNYAEHLFDKFMYDELYELVREESYLNLQDEEMKKELQMPLNTIQFAIKASIREDDSEKMVEFSLKHAKYLLNNYKQKTLFDAKIDDYFEKYLNLALGDIAIVAAKEGKFEDALGIVYKINDEFEYSLILRNIAEEQAKAGKFKDSLETAEKIKNEKFLAWVLRFIAEKQTKAGKIKDALETAEKIKEENFFAWILKYIAEEQTKLGKFKDALLTVEKLKNKYECISVLLYIAEMQANTNKKESINTIKRALELTDSIKDRWQQISVLKDIAKAQTKIGEFKNALQTVEMIESKWIHFQVLKYIAGEQAKAGEFKDAFSTAQKIYDEIEFAEALKIIAEAQIFFGMEKDAKKTLRKAVDVAQNIKNRIFCIWALMNIEETQTNSGMKKDARDILIKILEMTKNIEPGTQRISVLKDIAEMQAKIGRIKKTGEIYKMAIKEIMKIKDKDICFSELKEVAERQIKVGLLKDALDTAEKIKDSLKITSILIAIVQAQLNSGKIERANKTLKIALRSANNIRTESQRIDKLIDIAILQIESGLKKDGVKTFKMARELIKKIEDDEERVWQLSTLTEIQLKLGIDIQTIDIVNDILNTSYEHFLDIIKLIAERKDKDNFKKLLIPCSYYLKSAYRMCGYLAMLYPNKAVSIAKIILNK